MTGSENPAGNGEQHPLDEHLDRIHRAQQGPRRSLLGVLLRARRGEAEGDEAGEAAFTVLTLSLIGLAVAVLAALAGIVWLIFVLAS